MPPSKILRQMKSKMLATQGTIRKDRGAARRWLPCWRLKPAPEQATGAAAEAVRAGGLAPPRRKILCPLSRGRWCRAQEPEPAAREWEKSRCCIKPQIRAARSIQPEAETKNLPPFSLPEY